MRNLGGAIGLAVANTLMIQLNKQHYAVLREAVTPGSPEAQSLLAGLQENLSRSALPDSELAALKQLYGLVMREAEVLTLNTLFHTLSLTFFVALLFMPLVKKISAASAGADGGH